MFQCRNGRFMIVLRSFLVVAAALCAAGADAQPHARRVVVIGYDGLSARGLQGAQTPHISALVSSGAWTMHARAVLPTVSSPNWASMIMGAGPAQHGVTSNEWKPDQHEIEPFCKGPSGIFPTMFLLLRQQRPASDIAIFHHWEDFARLVEPGIPSVITHGQTAAETIQRALAYLDSHSPDLLFIHLDSIDDAGHKYGHLTPEYFQAIAEADRLTGELVQALEKRELRNDTVFLLTADHGGVGKKHGGNSMAELEIPWILSGPGVKTGLELKSPVNQFDTAATVAHLLGLQTPPCWIGRPVFEALRPREKTRPLPEPGHRAPPSTIRPKRTS
jgi:predicted AlkP superfamily pyrophosphatase or phosphodiesterase